MKCVLNLIHFHLLFYLNYHFGYLSGNMTTSSCKGLKWLLFYMYMPQIGQKSTMIKQVYNFKYTYTTEAGIQICALSSLSRVYKIGTLFTGREVYKFAHS